MINKIISIVVFVILGVAIIMLVLDNKKGKDAANSYQGQIKALSYKNDSILKRQDSLEYEYAELHIQYNNLSQINNQLFAQYNNAKHEIDSLKKVRNYITKVDSSVYRLNCKQLSDSLSIPKF